jgi:hypothetical protein
VAGKFQESETSGHGPMSRHGRAVITCLTNPGALGEPGRLTNGALAYCIALKILYLEST